MQLAAFKRKNPPWGGLFGHLVTGALGAIRDHAQNYTMWLNVTQALFQLAGIKLNHKGVDEFSGCNPKDATSNTWGYVKCQ